MRCLRQRIERPLELFSWLRPIGPCLHLVPTVAPLNAYDVGFLNRIVAPGKHLDVAQEYAQKISANAPLVLQAIKRFATATLPRGPAEHFYPEVGRLAAIMASADKDEGVAAFREKRKPRFTGR